MSGDSSACRGGFVATPAHGAKTWLNLLLGTGSLLRGPQMMLKNASKFMVALAGQFLRRKSSHRKIGKRSGIVGLRGGKRSGEPGAHPRRVPLDAYRDINFLRERGAAWLIPGIDVMPGRPWAALLELLRRDLRGGL